MNGHCACRNCSSLMHEGGEWVGPESQTVFLKFTQISEKFWHLSKFHVNQIKLISWAGLSPAGETRQPFSLFLLLWPLRELIQLIKWAENKGKKQKRGLLAQWAAVDHPAAIQSDLLLSPIPLWVRAFYSFCSLLYYMPEADHRKTDWRSISCSICLSIR